MATDCLQCSSISSSTQAHATLTYTVKSASRRASGVATGYMSSIQPGDTVNLAIRPAHGGFHLPVSDNAAGQQRPLICIAAGTGIAPFRGFAQERATAATTARKNLAPMLIFFGCRSREVDDLYMDEFDTWGQSANLHVYRAYSCEPTHGDAAGCRHVQDRLLREWVNVKELWDMGASIYVCGPRALAEAVREVIVNKRIEETSCGDREAAVTWLEMVVNPRFNIDLFD